MASNNDSWLRNHGVQQAFPQSARHGELNGRLVLAALRRAAGVFNNKETSGVDHGGAPGRTATKTLHAPAIFGANP